MRTMLRFRGNRNFVGREGEASVAPFFFFYFIIPCFGFVTKPDSARIVTTLYLPLENPSPRGYLYSSEKRTPLSRDIMSLKLIGITNAKTTKGEKKGYLTGILYLAPPTVSGYQVCPMAGECAKVCLFSAGRGTTNGVRNARIRKTKRFFEDRGGFMNDLVSDIKALVRKANRKDMIPVVRLNGTSDIRWETVKVTKDGVTHRNIMEAFPEITFYDYTKIPNRRNLPKNYSLTFSLDEKNGDMFPVAVESGMNVAVVFRKSLPETFRGLRVISGDEMDLRFIDPKGVVVGLVAKGKAKKDTSGFVRD